MRRHRLKLAIILVVLAAIGAWCWPHVQQYCSIVALDNALRGKGIVFFPPSGYMTPFYGGFESVARAVPAFAAPLVIRGRDAFFETRLYVLVAGPIEEINFNLSAIPPGLGEALHRFPRLRKLVIMDGFATGLPSSAPPISPEAWKQLCEEASSLPQLDDLSLIGNNVPDEALTSLAGHPKLERLMIYSNCLTPQCASSLARCPALKRLALNSGFFAPKADGVRVRSLTAALSAALPFVSVSCPPP